MGFDTKKIFVRFFFKIFTPQNDVSIGTNYNTLRSMLKSKHFSLRAWCFFGRGAQNVPLVKWQGHIFWPGALWLGAHNKGFFPTILTGGTFLTGGSDQGHIVCPQSKYVPRSKKTPWSWGRVLSACYWGAGLNCTHTNIWPLSLLPQAVLSVALPYSRLVSDFTFKSFSLHFTSGARKLS